MTPNTAAASKIQKFPNSAKMTPLQAIRIDPSDNTALRPIESANKVRKKLITTSPTSVRVINKPMRSSEIPMADRYDARIRVDPPYAKRRTKRCAQRSLTSSDDRHMVVRPSSSRTWAM